MKANTVASRLAVSIVGLGLFAAWQPALAADPGPADLVGALNGVFGVHPGMRAAHTKGFCLTGQFTPSPDAARSPRRRNSPNRFHHRPLFARRRKPASARQRPDNVRGLAVKFDLGNGASSDLVTTRRPCSSGRPPPCSSNSSRPSARATRNKIKAFFAAHPELTRQTAWLTRHPVPASYAGVDYFGVHAFTFTNAEGKATVVKDKLSRGGRARAHPRRGPGQGRQISMPPSSRSPWPRARSFSISPRLLAKEGRPGHRPDPQVGRRGQPPHHAARQDRIEAIAPDATCNASSFLPGNLVDGIAGPADDPIFQARSPCLPAVLHQAAPAGPVTRRVRRLRDRRAG